MRTMLIVSSQHVVNRPNPDKTAAGGREGQACRLLANAIGPRVVNFSGIWDCVIYLVYFTRKGAGETIFVLKV